MSRSEALWNISSLRIFKEQVSRKYREPVLSFDVSNRRSIDVTITIKIYFCTHYYTREAPQLSCFVRSIIFRCLKNDWHEWIHFLRTWNENSKLWTKKGIVYSRSTDKKFYTFNEVYENEKLCLIISKNRWKRFIPFTVAQDRDGFKLILSREWKAPSTPLYYTSLSQLYTSRKYFTGKKPCLIKITLEEAISLDTRGNA